MKKDSIFSQSSDTSGHSRETSGSYHQRLIIDDQTGSSRDGGSHIPGNNSHCIRQNTNRKFSTTLSDTNICIEKIFCYELKNVNTKLFSFDGSYNLSSFCNSIFSILVFVHCRIKQLSVKTSCT